MDCLTLRACLGWLRLAGYDVVLCDRYTYDKMVALPAPTGILSRCMLWLAPRPARALFLEVDPAVAAARKPEHHSDYYVSKHQAYQKVAGWNIGLKAIPSETIPQTQNLIRTAVEPLVGELMGRPAEEPCSIS